jgi:hypothetical protein
MHRGYHEDTIMPKIILAALLLGASLCASAQNYTPLQPWHAGAWYDPTQPGEGLMLDVTLVDGEPFVFAAGFFIADAKYPPQRWYVGQSITHDAWDGEPPFSPCSAPCYGLLLTEVNEIGGPPVNVGNLWLEPAGQALHWIVMAGVEGIGLRQGTLHRLLPAPPGSTLGHCYTWPAFGPHPPHANPVWCH